MGFFDSNKIKFNEISTQVKEFLVTTYSQTRSVFTTASPFGQILQVLSSYSQLFFLYLENSLIEMNILTATREKSVYGISRIAGHNPTRPISAQGTIKIRVKPGLASELNFSYLNLIDESALLCDNNSLPYFIKLGNTLGSITVNGAVQEYINIKIIQGEIETQTRRGNGQSLQSFTIISKKPIDNENVVVDVNGEAYDVIDSLYDMIKGDKSCLVKTGISGGIDIYFGNEDFGTIPPLGSIINIKYVLTDGFGGNIFSKTDQIKFTWTDEAFANTGEAIDLNEAIVTEIEKPIILGSDGELVEVTKLIAPKTSRSFVLANPDNYISFLSRFNYSYVDAYTTYDDEYIDDDNVIYLFLIPDIEKRLNINTDYFSTNLTNFYLSDNEKEALTSYINKSGRQIVTTELSIVDPILTRYTMNIFLRIFDTADSNTLKSEIINKITKYLLKVTRREKIPKSDLVAIIEAIKGVDSVNVSFISEVNEKAITDGFYIKRVTTFDQIRGIQQVEEVKVNLTTNQDPNLGLDDFGDIKIGLNELPVIRGGWYDRFGNYYQDGIGLSEYSSLNLVIKEVIKETLAVKLMNKNKDEI